MNVKARQEQARRLAGALGINADALYAGAVAAWSNLNPQSTDFEQALSVAAAVLSAATAGKHVGGYTDRAGIDNRANGAMCAMDTIIGEVHLPAAVRLVRMAERMAQEPILTDQSPAAYEVREQAARVRRMTPAELAETRKHRAAVQS